MSTKKFIFGIDLDGVLADFCQSYIKVLNKVSGKRADTSYDPTQWHFEGDLGFTPEEVKAAWKEIRNNPDFWFNLKEQFDAAQTINILWGAYTSGHTVYFISDRAGIHPHAQTTGWLVTRGFPAPSVLITPEQERGVSEKGRAARALGLTHFLDDKPENCWSVKQHQPSCQVYLLRKTYNDKPEVVAKAAEMGVIIVTSLRGFFEEMIKEEKAHAIVV